MTAAVIILGAALILFATSAASAIFTAHRLLQRRPLGNRGLA